VTTPLSPLDFLERARRLYGPLEAVVDGPRRLTYREFASRCHRLARVIRDLGAQPGDRVAYLCGNTLELLEAYYGVVLAGCILVPLNIRLSAAELQACLDDSDAALLVVHPALAAMANQLTPAARLDLGAGYEDLLAGQPDQLWDPGPIDELAVCEIFYTSGSTGQPRGAMLSHRALATHAVDSALTLGLTHRDTVLHTIALFHVNGWGTPHYVTALGARHVMPGRFDAGDVLRLVEAEGVTRLSLVPTMVSSLLVHPDLRRRDLSSLVQVTVGGAACPPVLLAELEDALGGRCEVICGYGLTEAAPQLTKAVTLRAHDHLPLAEQRRRRATTGLPNVGVDLRVLDDDGVEVPWDGITPGEICVRSAHVMTGYWRRPEETADAFRDGWLLTGDVATVDAEGYVTIVDRKKDLIISGGENISTVQVEQVLCGHPAVLEAAVVGMADEQWGEVPRAFVVLRPGADPVAGQELLDYVRARLAHFKAPRRVEIIEQLPKGGTGKVQKVELRRRPL
jgi:fatty-acyl-CoA synthase